MKTDFDSHTVEIPCSACGEKIPETIGRLKNDPDLTCSKCGAIIKIDASELIKGLDAAQKSLDDLGARLGNLFK